jgi:uncharacterized protein YndB with AHSA1/START domain
MRICARKETNMPTAADQEVRITHVFDAPRERVFRAWLDPDEVSAWYGPAGWTTPRDGIRIDARVGGRWELTMVPPGGGGGMPIGYEIVELVEPELLVLRSDPMPGLPEPTVVRVELRDEGGRTRMTLTDGPMPPAGCGPAEAGWAGAVEKLAALVGG